MLLKRTFSYKSELLDFENIQMKNLKKSEKVRKSPENM